MVCKFKDGDFVRIVPNMEDHSVRLFKVADRLTPGEETVIGDRLAEKWNWTTITMVVDDQDVHWIDTYVVCNVVAEGRDGKELFVNPLFAGKLGMVACEGTWNSEPPVPWYYIIIDGWGIGVSEPNLERAKFTRPLKAFMSKRSLLEL